MRVYLHCPFFFQMEENDNIEDISSHPYYVRTQCKFFCSGISRSYLIILLVPFVFIPATDFTLETSRIDDDGQPTSEFLNEKETNEGGEGT